MSRGTRYIGAALVCAAAATAGCRALEPWQEADLQRIEAAGLPKLEPKSPAAAGALNLLPGIGDAYNGEWGAFVCNLLLWPLSVVWGIPEAAITASNLNKQSTWAYYLHGPGKAEFQARDAEQGATR